MNQRKCWEFIIDMQLPSLNEYINICRRNPYQANNFKNSIEKNIGTFITKAKSDGSLTSGIDFKCNVFLTWYEKDFRRDVDNIQSGQKFILDALQKYGIIKKDSRKYINQIYHEVKQSEIGKSYVCVRIVQNVL